MKTLVKILMTLIVISSVVNAAEAKVLFTEKVGGTNGTNFMLPATRNDILSTENITRVVIKHGRRVESIEIAYTDRRNISQAEAAGNNAGQLSFFELEEGEFITYITGRAGTLIDQITFHTSMRRTFGPYGGNGGQDFEINIPSNAKVIGFTGKVGPSIKQIGLIYRTYDQGNDEPTGPGNSNDQFSNDHDAPEVFENSPQGPVIQTAPIPTSRNTRDHRSGTKNTNYHFDSIGVMNSTPFNKNMNTGIMSYHPDSIRVTKFTPATKEYDIRHIIEMNRRGNQEPIAKKSNLQKGRTSRDKSSKKQSYSKSSTIKKTRNHRKSN
jgi:hypothetical protein